MLSAAERKMGLEKSDTKLRDDISTVKVCGKRQGLSSLKITKVSLTILPLGIMLNVCMS